jgi:ABC-type transporter Mla subunit MlaD
VFAAVDAVRDGIAEALELVPRMAALLGRVEPMVDRLGALLDRVEQVVDRADAEIAAVHATRGQADEAIASVRTTQRKADALVTDFEPTLTALSPSLQRLAATLEPHEVEAMVTLIDRLPTLVTHLDEDILPILASLGNVGPDVNALVDIVQDMRQVVKGFPGSRLFRRRGAEEIAQDAAADAAGDAVRS